MRKGKSFKGSSKNRNKKLAKEDRRLIYTKKKSKREFAEKVVAREELQDYLGEDVEATGILAFINTRSPLSPVLVKDIGINGIHIDHMWIHFSLEDRRILKELPKTSLITFKGVVHEYVKRNDRQLGLKYGIKQPSLIEDSVVSSSIEDEKKRKERFSGGLAGMLFGK